MTIENPCLIDHVKIVHDKKENDKSKAKKFRTQVEIDLADHMDIMDAYGMIHDVQKNNCLDCKEKTINFLK